MPCGSHFVSHDILELLERVFLRLGSADSDEKLQATVQRFLVPTILKSPSKFQSVRDKVCNYTKCGRNGRTIMVVVHCNFWLFLTKVLEILTHISKRVKSRPFLLLPMATLLEQFTSPGSSPLAAVSSRCTK